MSVANDYEEYFKRYEKSEIYRTISKYFDESGCNKISLIEPCASLCKNSGCKDVYEWRLYYQSTDYYCNLQKATTLLKATLDANGVVYENKDAGLSLLTMIYWKTWIGCEAEIAAIQFLKRMGIECTIADRETDRKYAVDILIHKGSEIVAGIQVKPISYLRTQQRFNPEKNERFKKDYGCEVLYMFYDFSEKKFRKEDVRTIREYMKTIYNGKRCA